MSQLFEAGGQLPLDCAANTQASKRTDVFIRMKKMASGFKCV